MSVPCLTYSIRVIINVIASFHDYYRSYQQIKDYLALNLRAESRVPNVLQQVQKSEIENLLQLLSQG